MDPFATPRECDVEAGRLAALRRYDILDTPSDGAFDRITAMAARRFRAPISVVSLVDENRIWFKSHHGIDVCEISRDLGLCATTILGAEPRILTDARQDPVAATNPLVAGDFGLRFYAGVPLRTSDGHNLGTICVIDQEPRHSEPEQMIDLTDMAAIVMDEMELRISAKRAVAQAKLMAREIDHRVMNSLQFVSGLLAMQSRSVGEADPHGHLSAAANRVSAVAQVHRNFYAEDSDRVSATAFIRRLCADLEQILGRTVSVIGDDDQVATVQVQPIGLLVNELVTNAAKHGRGPIECVFHAIMGTDFTGSGQRFHAIVGTPL